MQKQIETGLHMVEEYTWPEVLNLLIDVDEHKGVIASEKLWQRGIEIAREMEVTPERSLLRTWKNQLSEPAVVIRARNARASQFNAVEKFALPAAWAEQVYEINLIADTGRLLQNLYENYTTGNEAVSRDVALVQMFTAVTLSEYLRCASGLGFVRSYDVEPNGSMGKDGEQGVRSPRGRYPVDTL